MRPAVCLALVIAPLAFASPGSCEETLGALLWAPEHLDKISGEFRGLGSQPGAFLVLANKLLALGSEQDFIELTNRQNVMSRIMGAYCLLQRDPKKYGPLLRKLTADKTPVKWHPFGCLIYTVEAGSVVRWMIAHPNILKTEYYYTPKELYELEHQTPPTRRVPRKKTQPSPTPETSKATQ